MDEVRQTNGTLTESEVEAIEKVNCPDTQSMFWNNENAEVVQSSSNGQDILSISKASPMDVEGSLEMDDEESIFSQEELEPLVDLAEFLMESVHRLVEEGSLCISQFPALYS